jgi:hypothetical protein
MPVALLIDLGDAKHVVFNRMESDQQISSIDTDVAGAIEVSGRAGVLVEDQGIWRPRYMLNPSGHRSARVSAVDYETGAITLDSAILDAAVATAGNVAIVDSERHSSVIPVASISSDKQFNVGGDPLHAARVIATSVSGDTIAFAPGYVYHTKPGMSVVDESGRMIGRVASMSRGSLKLDRTGPPLDALVDRDGDGRRAIRIVCVGIGDTVTLHQSERD